MFGKKKVATVLAEFLGSGVLTLVVIGVQHSTIGVPYFVGVAAALAAAMLVFVFGAISGAVLNPALTIALWSVRRLKTTAAIAYLVAQLLGAWAAYYLFSYHINTKLSPVGGDYSARVMLAEAFGTLILAFGWGYVLYTRVSDGAKAAVLGMGYALGIVVASSASIGLINPAVALADRAWSIWGSMGWGTYVLGPVLGALVGVNLYAWLFADNRRLAAARTTAGGGSSSVSTGAKSTGGRAKKAPARRRTTKR